MGKFIKKVHLNVRRVVAVRPHWTVFAGLLISLHSIESKEINLIARHYNADTNQLLYVERIKLNMINKMRTNENYTFFFPSGKSFGNLKTWNSDSAKRPSYEFRDKRDKRVEGVDFYSKNQFRIHVQRNGKSTKEEKKFRIKNDIITIPGLNNFITMQLDKILKKKSVVFKVALPSELDSFAFTMKFNRLMTLQGEKCVKVKMVTTNPVLRLFLRPIYLVYSLESNLIMQYQGIYFIRDPKQGWKGYYVIAKYKKR